MKRATKAEAAERRKLRAAEALRLVAMKRIGMATAMHQVVYSHASMVDSWIDGYFAGQQEQAQKDAAAIAATIKRPDK